MILSGRRLLLGLAIVIVACGVTAWLRPEVRWPWMVVAGAGIVIVLIVSGLRPPLGKGLRESDEIAELTSERRAELMRGTSKFLREMRYRYSVRSEPGNDTDRRCFTAEVNGVRLGFVPALVTDNTNDRQGYGYVAFVYDQRRWRGPGLPCPAGQAEAVQHAARCVSPLASDEETRFYG